MKDDKPNKDSNGLSPTYTSPRRSHALVASKILNGQDMSARTRLYFGTSVSGILLGGAYLTEN